MCQNYWVSNQRIWFSTKKSNIHFNICPWNSKTLFTISGDTASKQAMESFSTGWASIQNPFFMLERQFERRWQTSSLVLYSLPSPGLDSQPVYHAIQKQI